ncbi:hypothetical protein OROGR_018464 [Orobanche gracilis]
MAKVGTLPLAFRISLRPTKMSRPFSASVLALRTRYCTRSVFFLNYSLLRARSFCGLISERADENSGKPLPWLSASMERERRKIVKNETSKGARSSWEDSAEKFLEGGGGGSSMETRETRKYETLRNELGGKDNTGVEDGDEEGKIEDANDLRWYNIKKRYDNLVEIKPGSDRSEVRRWNKQDNWGRKTWKEANESTLPKIVGEGIYGVGPVLAALSSGRREFYALYVQEGLHLSTNNNKKKDKKGFSKVVKMAEKLGVSKKEVSKHNLNMIVDNRPHQGLVLDASPLEMVGIKELDPISCDGEKGPLWLALDEVTDPQNLGAIIRSAYFFGASGVVLCAKNSAPLSGVVSKASAGSLELIELRSCKNMMQFLASSAGNGWQILGGSVSPSAIALSDIVPGGPTILVLGSEGAGLRPLVERSCTRLIRIPGNQPVMMRDEDIDNVEDHGREFRSFMAVDSLNVSVAAGVMLHYLIGRNYEDSGYVPESKLAYLD